MEYDPGISKTDDPEDGEDLFSGCDASDSLINAFGIRALTLPNTLEDARIASGAAAKDPEPNAKS